MKIATVGLAILGDTGQQRGASTRFSMPTMLHLPEALASEKELNFKNICKETGRCHIYGRHDRQERCTA